MEITARTSSSAFHQGAACKSLTLAKGSKGLGDNSVAVILAILRSVCSWRNAKLHKGMPANGGREARSRKKRRLQLVWGAI
ncbi:hypothetical protein KFL_001450250 [Klebsormidium nitens]|uniref:Uncharacterized protein n=1 Tax=Klebsormidium nitens TaxID=105231 RepID=A0A1Y1I070_KLENI|nr:hypothetical protein KFL_001450250 [Klebsormidium nitens]|eukprot:GAQ83372.1 hypothetical protein KFL_001450250 [Klebsormidium nitens]